MIPSDDFAFLEALHAKTSDRPGHTTDDFKLSVEEMQRILKIAANDDVLFEPINTDFGFRVSFILMEIGEIYVGLRAELTERLLFTERHLPEGYDWGVMQAHFTGRERRAFLCLGPTQSRDYYDY